MKSYILSFLFICVAFVGYSQDFTTFAMQFEGEEVQATQNIDSKYLGAYLQDKGSRKYQYNLQKNGSFYLEQTNNDWNTANQKPIEWGVLVNGNEIAKAFVTVDVEGVAKKYEATIIIIRNATTSEYSYYNLYERDGSIYLDEAVKVSEVAKNEN